MKKMIIILSLLSASSVMAATMPTLDLSGKYICNGNDSQDGAFKDVVLTLTLDAKNSLPQYGYGAYHYSVVTPSGAQYSGAASASGNAIAMYYPDTVPGQATNHGISIGFITHDKNSVGKVTTTWHKYYYEPDYKQGANGLETCVKQS